MGEAFITRKGGANKVINQVLTIDEYDDHLVKFVYDNALCKSGKIYEFEMTFTGGVSNYNTLGGGRITAYMGRYSYEYMTHIDSRGYGGTVCVWTPEGVLPDGRPFTSNNIVRVTPWGNASPTLAVECVKSGEEGDSYGLSFPDPANITAVFYEFDPFE